MASQRELRTRSFPLLERIDRQIQKEDKIKAEKETKLSKDIKSLKPKEAKDIKPRTKLVLLNNKRRYR